MQIHVNGTEVDIGYDVIDSPKINMEYIVEYISSCHSQQIITAVEIDGEEYYPGDIPYEDISVEEVERLNFVTEEIDDAQMNAIEQAKNRVPELRKTLRNSASEFMLGDEDKAWEMFLDSAEELNDIIDELSEKIIGKVEFGCEADFEKIEVEHENTNVHSMTAPNLFRLEGKEAAESAEEMAEIAEMLEEFIGEYDL